jgi:hypothetical protein
MPDFSAERMSEHFVNYLFEEYEGGQRHVRRISAWLGLLALGIEKIKVTWRPSRAKQMIFEVDEKRYKVRYKHSIKPKGGLQIVEIAKTQGAPDIRVAWQIASLRDAENFYRNPKL